MIDADFLVVWFSLMFPLVFSPGPANLALASLAAKKGYAGALPFLFGIEIGACILTLVLGFGFGALQIEQPLVFRGVESAGVFYIFYLAYKFAAYKSASEQQTKKPSLASFGIKNGIVLSLLNGKLYPMLTAMFSQFLTEPSHIVFEVLLLTAMFIGFIFFGHSTWALLGNFLKRKLKSVRAQNIQKYTFALMLFLVGIWLLYENLTAWYLILTA